MAPTASKFRTAVVVWRRGADAAADPAEACRGVTLRHENN